METSVQYPSRVIWWVRIAVVCVFLGRGYQFIFWDTPIRALLWDQELMQPIVESILGMPWETYVTSAGVDRWMNNAQTLTGVYLLFLGVLSMFVTSRNKRLGKLLLTGAGILIVLALLYFKSRFLYWGQFIEYTAQIGVPIFLYALLYLPVNAAKIVLWLKIAIALTFLGHGMYAIGFYPVPGHFVTMLYNITGWSETSIITILKIAGYLDFLVAIGIFLPNRAVVRTLLMYAMIWGGLTALARIVSPLFYDLPTSQWLHEYLYEFIYRTPHALLPLAALLLLFPAYGRKRDIVIDQ